MRIPIYQVDAFASEVFRGNPAAVCVLDSWPDDALLQSIAAENNLAETAFLLRTGRDRFDLRWFTPSFEIPLCGHATMAAGYVVFRHIAPDVAALTFSSASGDLLVRRLGDRIEMDFPAYDAARVPTTQIMIDGRGGTPREVLKAGINLYAVFDSEETVRTLVPDYRAILDLIRGTELIGIVPTSAGTHYDFVSRYFAPEEGTNIGEDPVTGSIHCVLIPLWANRLGKTRMKAYQASPRGGELDCELIERDGVRRTLIGGMVQPYLTGYIEV